MSNNNNLQLNNEEWIPEDVASEMLSIKPKTLRERCRKNQYIFTIKKTGKKAIYYIHKDSISKSVINYQDIDNELSSDNYSDSPDWAKMQADKYIHIIDESKDLNGKELELFVENWNKTHKPELNTSYPSIIKMRRRYKEDGLSGLLARYGHSYGKVYISKEDYEYFKNLYLVEGSPSLRTCWDLTFGHAKINNPNLDRSSYPSYMTFKRRLEEEIPLQSIYLARKGEAAWNRKYANYMNRDYSNIVCGKVWVSDHAQIDVACFIANGNIIFPWVTAWRDFKSGKWLGWILQSGYPNSDYIFQSFYYSVEKFGLPEEVIIDNGKDYRSKDFAGGRQSIKIDVNKFRTTSMLDELNIKVNFALPYNAQTKPIERDFLKVKELLSKHCLGYRGGNVVERPEKLIKDIKNGKILDFDSFKIVFNDFIINVLNKRPSEGKNLNGLSPDELFNEEFKEKIEISSDALKLFCMRTSRNFTIGRNGIHDRELDIFYWADWMISRTRLKVYLRRDPLNYKEAWAFKVDNEEFVGKVFAVKAVAALHADTVSKEEFKEAMAIKKRNLKIAKAYIKQTQEISIQEKCENYKAAYAKVIKDAKPKVSKIANTKMDKAIRKNKEMEAYGKADLSKFLEIETKPVKPLYLFETDKILAEESKGAANGY